MLNLTRPEWVREIHARYAAAGSRVIYANTFGANPLKLPDTAAEAIAAGIRIAREAAGDGVLVAAGRAAGAAGLADL